MLVVSAKVFDDVITGTGTTWYSPAQLSEELGAADDFGLHATVTGLSGTSPTLTVQMQHSGDNQNWISTATPEISTSLTNDHSYYGWQATIIPLHFVRLQITLGGTTPQCRLKVYVAGHDWGH